MFILLAIICILISAMLFTIKKDNKTIVDKKGIIYAILSALFFGTNALIQKYATNNGLVYAQQVYFAGMVFILLVIFAVYLLTLLALINNILI